MKTFYATLSSSHTFGRRKGPGYVEISAENEAEARKKIAEATSNRWAFLYDSKEKLHPLDKIRIGWL